MSIKSIILGTASVVAISLASNASAADLIKHHKIIAAPKAVVSFSWEGAYAGVNGGVISEKISRKGVDGKWADVKDYAPKGAFGGIYAGYNADLGNNIIGGVDADVNISAVKKDIKEDKAQSISSSYYRQPVNGAVRARVGYAFDRILPYIAGGISFADIKSIQGVEVVDGKVGDKKLKNSFQAGWNVGAGVDYAISDNVILRADYRFSRISEPKANVVDENKNIVLQDQKDVRLVSNSVRVGVAYKF